MIGNIPHAPLARLSVGTHVLVVRKLGPTSIRKGTPLVKTKMMIKKMAKTVEIAQSSKISWMKRSFASLVLDRSIVLSSSFGVMSTPSVKKRKGELNFRLSLWSLLAELQLSLWSLLAELQVVALAVVADVVAAT